VPSNSTAPAPATPAPAPAPTPAPSTATPAAVTTAVNFAKAQLGKAYVFGGAGPDVWDCSGLMMGAYNAAGVYIGGHSVRWQYNYLSGQGRLVPISSMKIGDILIYNNATDGMYHDAMYVGNGQMLEAPNPSATVRIVAVRYFQLYAVGRPVG
jgi:cell wall-associated NlpC family hydrolase